jgi:hypothetical protein
MASRVSMLNRIWVLKKDELYSPWHAKIVPTFLDFSKDGSTVIVRGYGEQSETEYSYSMAIDTLKIGERMNFKIKSINNLVLVLIIGQNEYSYFEIQPKSNAPSIVGDIYKSLSSGNKWLLKDNLLEFTLEETNLTTEKSYKAIEYRNNKKYFGTYFLDFYRGNIFLILLVDGKYKEEVFQILNFSPTCVELSEIDYIKSEVMISVVR